MQNKNRNMLIVRNILSILIAVRAMAATPPQVGETIELAGMLNARASKYFTSEYNNILVTLPAGTKATVNKVVNLPSGNSGLCISPEINASLKLSESALRTIEKTKESKDCQGVWIYFRKSNSHIINLSRNENNNAANAKADFTKAGDKIKTTKPIAALAPVKVDKKSDKPWAFLNPPSGNQNSVGNAENAADKSTDKSMIANAAAAQVVSQIGSANANLNQQLNGEANKSVDCPECRKKSLRPVESCEGKKNNYLQSILTQDSFSQAIIQYSGNPIIKEACFQSSLQNSHTKYFSCDGGQMRYAPRACITNEYLKLAANSFNGAADCLKDYLNESSTEQDKRKSIETVFYLFAHESGHHLNAISSTGAKGIGQLTEGAIKASLKTELSEIKDLLRKSSNSFCQTTALAAVEDSFKDSYKCEYTSIKNKNPMKNIITSLAYQKIVRDSLTRSFFNKAYGQMLTSTLKEDDKNYLLDQMTMWGHNTGEGSILYAAKNTPFYSKENNSSTLKTRKDVEDFLESMKYRISSKSNGEHRKFREHVMKKSNEIKNEANACLQ